MNKPRNEGMKQANPVARIWDIPMASDGGRTGSPLTRKSPDSGKVHALNIGTMATWMTMFAACLTGLLLTHAARENPRMEKQETLPETIEIAMSERFGTADGIPADENEVEPVEQQIPEEALPPAKQALPPEIPATQEMEALPALPDLPAPVPAVRQAPRPQAETTSRPSAPAARRPARTGNPESRGATRQSENTTTSISPTRRLAGGSMPKPKYPAAARSRGQTGTVVVEFIVGENGRVVSAHATNPSPWPLLNEAAVKAVRGWRFPPGGVTTYTRPIIFNLN